MKLTRETASRIVECLVEGIAKKAIYTGQVPQFWQLYLDADVQLGLDIVDTCATSQCLSVLAKAQYKDEDLLNEAVASVVRLRNKAGSWPSAITPDELEFPAKRRPGDTAIGDNCFALTALLDANFLDDKFKYYKQLPSEYQNLYSRLSFVFVAIDWLLENKAKDQIGWYYTDNKKEGKASVVLTTLNVLLAFSNIIRCLNECIQEAQLTKEQLAECAEYVQKLTGELHNTVKILIDIDNIYENIQYQWSAIGGATIGMGEPSIIHTCKLLNLIWFNKEYNQFCLCNDDIIQDMVRFILENIQTPKGLQKYCAPFYFEGYTLHKTYGGLGLPAREIYVDHENFAEGIILFTLINICRNYGSVDPIIMTSAINALTSEQRMFSKKPYFFLCRSQREIKNNWTKSVYASYEAYKALKIYIDHYDLAWKDDRGEVQAADLGELKQEINQAIKKLEREINLNQNNWGFALTKANNYLSQLKKLQENPSGITKEIFYQLLGEIAREIGVEF